jgi:hypothetical protein
VDKLLAIGTNANYDNEKLFEKLPILFISKCE